MAISGWMIWGRREPQQSSHIDLDLSKELKENIKEALIKVCSRQGVPHLKKLGYLNAIVRLVTESKSQEYGFTSEELFTYLRIGLIQEATQVRGGALRAIRYLLKKQEDVVTINKLQYPYFIARSMDVNLRNEMERLQAIRLVRRILVLAPKSFSPVLARSLISLTNGGAEDRDRTYRVFLATVCELGVMNSNLLISCGGVGALTRAVMLCTSPAIIESIVGVLLRLLTNPETRSSVSLFSLAAPYCELHSTPTTDHLRESRESRFSASKQALISVLRSYPGVLSFCHPNDHSGLKAISDILYVDQLEVRGAVLELLYELLGIPLPMWTDEPDVALAAVDPSRTQENWKLAEGFVAAEGRSILPPLVSHFPNITELHLALLVYVLLECGLHRALAETIVTSDTFISVRAAVLLGGLLHLAHSLLPPEVCDLTPPLPNLLEHASLGRHQALAAVTILGRMHAMMRRKPAPSSLFLDRILQAGTWLRPSLPRKQRTSSRNWLRRDSPATTPLLKDAVVLTSKDSLLWNWPVIRSILRSRDDALRVLHDSDHRIFIKRLVRYFKPTSNSFSRVELGTSVYIARETTLAGCDLINCLLELYEPEGIRLLNELMSDISEQISEITSQPSAHDCLFSPRHMTTTCCQKYFLFLGQLSHSAKGTVILKSFNLLQKLEDLAIATNHDCYVKLIISSLDYTKEGPNRKVMNKIISSATLEQTRLYATQFLRLILRAKINDALQWAMSLLIDRLKDNSKIVAHAALEALHEACAETEFLEIFMQQGGHDRAWDKWLEHLGDRGYLLNIRLYSLVAGYTRLSSPAEELEKWTRPAGFCERYVGQVEGEIHDSLTRRQRGENGNYLRRQSNILITPKDVFIPPHLLGQFVQHELGVQLIARRNVIQKFARTIQRFRMDFGKTRNDTNSKWTKSSPSFLNDTYLMSEESGNEEMQSGGESSRLETIIDAKVMETCQPRIPRKNSYHFVNDSQQTTPEKSSSSKSRDDFEQSFDIEERILRAKAALWSLGHVGTAPAGINMLQHYGVIEIITNIAETCQYYSVRATAMYALSLISTTKTGADALTTLNWPCVRFKRGDYWPVVPPTSPHTVPSPVPIQKHHRSLSDGKPELPEPIARRTRNRSESAATELECRRFAFPERGETPSPVSSVQRLSQQDAEGYAKLRSLQRHRRPSYSHSSLEMYSSDGRLSLTSLSESSRSWTVDNNLATTPPPPVSSTKEEDASDGCYMGICLPRNLESIFPHPSNSGVNHLDSFSSSSKMDMDTSVIDEESGSESNSGEEHWQICLICSKEKSKWNENISDNYKKIRKEILRHVQRLSNPVWYRHSRRALLRIRQNCPEMFQDVCIYSKVSARLGSGTYRLPARRFIQELFLESPFDALHLDPSGILIAANTEDVSTASIPIVPDSEIKSEGSPLPNKSKINGRMLIPEIVDEVPSSTENEPRTLCSHLKSSESCLQSIEKLDDEKIIAEILKPAERLKISKRSDNKLLKVTGTNTAISLE